MNSPRLHIDFESRSTVDLKAAGIDNYARHPTTSPWCMGWAFDDDEPQVWVLGEPLPERVREHVANGGIVVAHNASFELAIWNHICVPRYGWPVLKPEQVRDTMAMAYAMALPGSLEKAAAAVGIAQQKDMAGHRLMMQMSRPRTEDPLTWWDDFDKQLELHAYCKQDVRVERELDKRLMALSDHEQRVWALDQRINARGIYVDRKAVDGALGVVAAEQLRLNERMRETTQGFVSVCSETARLTKWICSRGVPIEGVAKADVLDALELDGLPGDVRAALLLRQEAGKSSTAKLKPMVVSASADGRVRFTLQYHAAGTGRWGGRRVQPHNLPRPKIKQKDIEQVIAWLSTLPPAEAIAHISVLYDSPLDILPSCLRGLICAAPGNDLLAADFANIEGRVLVWLADERWKLDAFRAYDAGTGHDLYKLMAGSILGKAPQDATGDERQTFGKVPELACGYGGGVGAFQQMAKTYLVKVADELADRIKSGWREKHPRVVSLWYAYEGAALDACLNPGTVFSAGPGGRAVKFKVAGSFLWCLLPSGRPLCYPYPKVLPVKTPWGVEKDAVTYMTVVDSTKRGTEKIIEDASAKGDWQRVSTYGGKLVENVDQAISRDILVASIERVEAAGYPVVLHVHDEIVSEKKKGEGDLRAFEALCAETPAWAAGLPVTAAGWRGERYRKG